MEEREFNWKPSVRFYSCLPQDVLQHMGSQILSQGSAGSVVIHISSNQKVLRDVGKWGRQGRDEAGWGIMVQRVN